MTTRWRSHIPRPCLSFTHLASSGFSLDRTPLQLMIMMTAAALRRARAPADTIRHAAAAICATARAVRVRPKLPTAYLATRRAVYYCPAPTGAVPGKMCVRSARVQMHKRERNAIPRTSADVSAPLASILPLYNHAHADMRVYAILRMSVRVSSIHLNILTTFAQPVEYQPAQYQPQQIQAQQPQYQAQQPQYQPVQQYQQQPQYQQAPPPQQGYTTHTPARTHNQAW